MKSYYWPIALVLMVFCSSCNMGHGFDTVSVIGLFIIMLLLFATMIVIIVRKKRKADKSLVRFSVSINGMLKKFDTPEEKAETLNLLIKRIENDEKYSKDENWKKQVLCKVYQFLATQYFKMNDNTLILEACSKIIELDPKDFMAYYNRGSLYCNMGIYTKALDDLNRTIELMSKYANAYNNRGMVLEKLGHHALAIADYGKAIKLDDTPITHYNRGNCFFQMKEYAKALSDYRFCLSAIEDKNEELAKATEKCICACEEKTGRAFT